MNPTENKTTCSTVIDASCRVPLLALLGGAALWLVLGLALGMAAMMSFHKPDMFADVPFLTYGRAQAAANDLLLYGFVIPSALAVVLWIFSRLSQTSLALPIVPVVAANLWHLGVLVGTIGILIGEGTGHPWLEYPRAAAVILFAAFMLIAISALATFGARVNREMIPAHWYLLGALLLFPWIYSTANLFLVSGHPPRGVTQAVIGWWFGNNLLFVWLTLLGTGVAFYFLPKFSGKTITGYGYALFGFLTLIFFGTWCGIPQGAPVPAWLPTVGSFFAALTLVSVLAIAIAAAKVACGCCSKNSCSTSLLIKFGMLNFAASALFYISQFCPQYSRVLEFTWFGFAVSQWQILGFAGVILFGAIYHILPLVMDKPLPFSKLAKLSYVLFAAGVLLYAIPLLVGGMEQGMKLRDASVPFAEAGAVAIKFIRISTMGQLAILLAALCLLLNILVMTIQWKLGLVKMVIKAVKAPLATSEVKS